jgi:hypothetical protein
MGHLDAASLVGRVNWVFEVPRDENGSLEIAIPRYIESIVISMYRVCTVLYIYVIYVCVYNMYLYIYIYICLCNIRHTIPQQYLDIRMIHDVDQAANVLPVPPWLRWDCHCPGWHLQMPWPRSTQTLGGCDVPGMIQMGYTHVLWPFDRSIVVVWSIIYRMW